MGIIATFKTLNAVNKATKFVKEHKDTVQKVKALIDNVENAIEFLKEKRDFIQAQIDKALIVVNKLKGFFNK